MSHARLPHHPTLALRSVLISAVAGCLSLVASCAGPARQSADGAGGGPRTIQRQAPFVRRAFDPTLGGKWVGNGIAYGPHRDGQAPSGPHPSRAQIREDLGLIARHWNLIRMYGAVGNAETVLSVIREDRLPIHVLLGVWLAPEEKRDSSGTLIESFPAIALGNHAEIETAVRLANTYRDLCVGISAGNETQVSWSDHRIPPRLLIQSIRTLRARTRVPVTTADDFNFWNKPESHAIAHEVDFVFLHAHPLWNGITLEHAVDWTVGTCEAIQLEHPGVPVIIGETGWATARHNEGEQARLIRGAVGVAEQKVFHDAFVAWARKTRTPAFLFEAFDENWKGGSHPDEVEKHWGLYHADRTPKLALTTEH